MTTTENPAAPLPFLLPAANLAVGDTVRDTDVPDWTIAGITTTREGDVAVRWADGGRGWFAAGHLVQVMSRQPVAVLNDLVTALTELTDEWQQTAVRLDKTRENAAQDGNVRVTERADAGVAWLKGCTAEVRAILDRLQ
jgi:hypothetical protein